MLWPLPFTLRPCAASLKDRSPLLPPAAYLHASVQTRVIIRAHVRMSRPAVGLGFPVVRRGLGLNHTPLADKGPRARQAPLHERAPS